MPSGSIRPTFRTPGINWGVDALHRDPKINSLRNLSQVKDLLQHQQLTPVNMKKMRPEQLGEATKTSALKSDDGNAIFEGMIDNANIMNVFFEKVAGALGASTSLPPASAPVSGPKAVAPAPSSSSSSSQPKTQGLAPTKPTTNVFSTSAKPLTRYSKGSNLGSL